MFRSIVCGGVFALGFLATNGAAQQQYIISTVAGGAPPATPARGVDLWLQPYGLVADAAGNVYFGSLTVVFKMDRNGIATRVAGNARQGYSGDGGPATEAQLSYVGALAIDRSGNLFIGDGSRIRRVSASGIITTVAGGSVPCNYSGPPIFCPGDGGPAVDAQLNTVSSLAVDGDGNLFVGSYDSRVRKVSIDGIIRAFCRHGKPGLLGRRRAGGGRTTQQSNGPGGGPRGQSVHRRFESSPEGGFERHHHHGSGRRQLLCWPSGMPGRRRAGHEGLPPRSQRRSG